MRGKKYLLILLVALTSLLAYAYLRKSNFFEIDACLDCGGRWNYETEQCETISRYDRTRNYKIH